MVLTSCGSSGDVNPIVALGLGLRARGHDVAFVFEERLCASVGRLGFAARSMSGNLEDFFRAHLATFFVRAFRKRLRRPRDSLSGSTWFRTFAPRSTSFSMPVVERISWLLPGCIMRRPPRQSLPVFPG
jgi:UDP:flavonoid glycosyltransferase YjiC (YdhE family)